MSKRVPVFVYKQDQSQVGSGMYPAVACFVTLGIHVPFTYHFHAGDSDLREVGEPLVCDGSCEQQPGDMEDFSKKRTDHDYEVTRIVETALAFSGRKKRRVKQA